MLICSKLFNKYNKIIYIHGNYLMLSVKEITEKFEVTRATLHNWKTTKPNLYNYLKNPNDVVEKYREINIFLETYIKTTQNITAFEYKEIEYIFALELELKDLKSIENLHLTYINASINKEKESSEFTLDIYKKLESLNLIEKYVFANRLKILVDKIKSKKEEKEELLRHYFKEFM